MKRQWPFQQIKWRAQQILAVLILYTEQITYFQRDALGSPVAATDEQGNTLWRKTYQPYGERINDA
jgi:hypothetical protein